MIILKLFVSFISFGIVCAGIADMRERKKIEVSDVLALACLIVVTLMVIMWEV